MGKPRLVLRHPSRFLMSRWVEFKGSPILSSHGLPMLAERLSDRRIQVNPAFNWRKFPRSLQSMEWYDQMKGKFPDSFVDWLSSGDAFAEIPISDLEPSLIPHLLGLRARRGGIVDLLGEYPHCGLRPATYRTRSLLWWHLGGMTIEMLAELAEETPEDVSSGVEEALAGLVERIGFQVFANQVDTTCIIGGDVSIPYLKRILLADKYARRPLKTANLIWKKCILPMYYRDPTLLRHVGGTGAPYQSRSFHRTRLRGESIGPKEVYADKKASP